MQKYLHTTWRLWKLLKPFHKDFYIQLFLTIIIQAAGIYLIYLSSRMIDSLVKFDISLAIKLGIGFSLIRSFVIVFDYMQEAHNLKKMDLEIQEFLQKYSFKKIFKLNPSQFQEDHSAIKLAVITRGEQSAMRIVSIIVLELLPVLTQIAFSLAMIFLYSKYVFLITLSTILIFFFWVNKFNNYHRPFVKINMDKWDRFAKIRTEAFQHLSMIKILSVVKKFNKKYQEDREDLKDYAIFTWSKQYIHALKRRFFFVTSRNISTFIIIYQIYLREITVGGLYAVWQYINNVYDQIGTIARYFSQLPMHYQELEKYLEIIDKVPDFNEHGKYSFVDGDIEFKNLSFKYPKGESNVLENLNLTIKKGQRVAFVGHSGSGKTTITKLLLRAYDYNNSNNETDMSITINNVELKDINADDLRTHIGYVEQHVDLFDDTVKNNILLSVQEDTLRDWEKNNLIDMKLEEISKLARIDEFYHRLGDKKFDTEIGERGIKLSGGERQRIGIARAIVRDPQILIFDEATSALDTVNEKYIKEAIDNVSKGRTTIIIAHRLSTVVDSDLIVVMDKGQIVASGKHDELLATSTQYQELIKHQEFK